jgi:DNA-binding CsgD family transcriptional regulator
MKQNINPETLLRGLTPEEHEMFIWLREAFTIEWIAETLMRDKREVKTLAAQVYKALEVRNREELIAYYGALDKEAPRTIAEKLSGALARYNMCVEMVKE